MTDPTPRQQAVLDYLLECLTKTGIQPSHREIAAHFGWTSPAAAQAHLIALEKKGYIERSGGRARSIIVRLRGKPHIKMELE